MSASTELVRRCLWCQARVGHERYFLDGIWEGVHSPKHLFGDARFTDGICPDCLVVEKAKILGLSEGRPMVQAFAGGVPVISESGKFKSTALVASSETILEPVDSVLVDLLPTVRIGRTWSGRVRSFFGLAKMNRRGNRLGRLLALSHKEWVL